MGVSLKKKSGENNLLLQSRFYSAGQNKKKRFCNQQPRINAGQNKLPFTDSSLTTTPVPRQDGGPAMTSCASPFVCAFVERREGGQRPDLLRARQLRSQAAPRPAEAAGGARRPPRFDDDIRVCVWASKGSTNVPCQLQPRLVTLAA